jgi:hypothetical protein
MPVRGCRGTVASGRSLLAAIIAALAWLGPAATAANAAPLATGCAPSRPAIAHHAGAVALSPQPSGLPVPCLHIAGPSTETATVAIAPDSAILYAPTLTVNGTDTPTDLVTPAHVSRSLDGGTSWTAETPGSVQHTAGIAWMDVDHRTGRIWFASPLPDLCGAVISWSDDDGASWQTNPKVGCPSMGGMSVFEGPAPAGGARPVGYPHVVYYCGNEADGAPNLLFCYRSLDGGSSFQFIGSFPNTPPPTASCDTASGLSALERPRGRTVTPNGFVYMSVDMCGALGVALSKDEGATWTVSPIFPTTINDLDVASIASDQHGNLYIAWLGPDNLPYLTVSSDGGRDWSPPMMVASPRVDAAQHVAVTATGDGDIAIAYLGSSDGGTEYGGYITQTHDAFDASPVFWSAEVNDPTQPLINGADSNAAFGDRLWFLTADFAPDGTPWAAFHCAKTTACPDERLGIAASLSSPHHSP